MQKPTNSFTKPLWTFLLILGLISNASSAKSSSGSQANITLIGGATTQHQYNNTSWSLTKSSNSVIAAETTWPNTSNGTVVWNVTATKKATTSNTLAFYGYIGIQNSGDAPASIGNIVVNLQRNINTNWVTIASDIANANQGESATTANVILDTNLGGRGILYENEASGKLSLTDANGNTTWSLVPTKTIAAGELTSLVFNAEFNNALLTIPDNEQVRLEVIVSFGNAGSHSGGATASHVDINGDGLVSSDEIGARSVPYFYTVTVPTITPHNATVSVLDLGIDVTGTAEVDFDTLLGFGTQITSQTFSFSTSVGITAGGTLGGKVCNSASLAGEDTTISVIIGYNPDLSPIYQSFTYPGIQVQTPLICVDIPADPQELGEVYEGNDNTPTAFRTYTQDYYRNSNVSISSPLVVGITRSITFSSSIVTITHPAKGNIAAWTETISKTISQNINEYFSAGDGGIGYLTNNLLNPTNTSAHNYGHQVVTMKINLLLSASGVTPFGLGELVYHEASSAEDGKTIGQIVTDAEIALGTGNSPGGSPSDLMPLLDNLIHSFDNIAQEPSSWGAAHLSY